MSNLTILVLSFVISMLFIYLTNVVINDKVKIKKDEGKRFE